MADAPQDFATIVGQRITAAMEAAGQTKAALGYALSSPEGIVRESDLRRWTSGRHVPSAIRFGQLADALGVTVDYLLGRATHPQGAIVPGSSLEVVLTDRDWEAKLRAVVDLAEGPTPGASESHTSPVATPPENPVRKPRARRQRGA